jgi:hypothetical protein
VEKGVLHLGDVILKPGEVLEAKTGAPFYKLFFSNGVAY